MIKFVSYNVCVTGSMSTAFPTPANYHKKQSSHDIKEILYQMELNTLNIPVRNGKDVSFHINQNYFTCLIIQIYFTILPLQQSLLN